MTLNNASTWYRGFKLTSLLTIVLGALIFIASCANTPEVKPVVGPDGMQDQLITCGGMATTIESCYAKAREVCGGNYQLVNSDSGGGRNTYFQLLVKCPASAIAAHKAADPSACGSTFSSLQTIKECDGVHPLWIDRCRAEVSCRLKSAHQ